MARRLRRQAVAQTSVGVAGTVALGTLPSVDVVDLPSMLSRLREAHPMIRVLLRTSPSGSGGLSEEGEVGMLDAARIANDGSRIPGMRLTWLSTAPSRR